MDRGMNIHEYWPNVFSELREFKGLAKAENPEIKLMWESWGKVLSDQFVQEATERGVRRWEGMLSIIPKGSDSLDLRKFRVLARLNEKLPYTLRTLHHLISTLCGQDYSLNWWPDEYRLEVKVFLSSKEKLQEVEALLQRILPVNLLVDVSLKYNTYSQLMNYTHGALAAYTYEQLRNELI